MKSFDYAAPASLAEATALLARQNGTARILAGGTDILVQLREDLRDADLVVDVKNIPELMELSLQPRDGLAARGGRALLPRSTTTRRSRPPIRPWPTRRGSSAAGRSRAGPASAGTSATRRRPATRSRR